MNPSALIRPDQHIVVMAKYPSPGRVKTRLARVVGPARASALYEAFLLDLGDRLREAPMPVVWAFWPPDAPFAGRLQEWSCRPQRGADLGARMAHAIADELATGAAAVVVIGADVPHVPLAALSDACVLLATGVDVVLGPANDGGYYLIAVRALHPELFTDMPWGSDRVCAETLRRTDGLGLTTRLLAPTFDIDDMADVRRLWTMLQSGAVVLPRTAALLEGAEWDHARAVSPLDSRRGSG